MNRIAAGGGTPETVARLLAAWRGEVEARAIYEALAARQPDRERAAILRRNGDIFRRVNRPLSGCVGGFSSA